MQERRWKLTYAMTVSSRTTSFCSLLPQVQPFVFQRTITDALCTLNDVCCTSKNKLPRTLFVLLLVSTRDPSLERHEHEAFRMPSSLRDHCYAIVGTGFGGNGILAHNLSKGSKGPNGERLLRSMPNITSINLIFGSLRSHVF